MKRASRRVLAKVITDFDFADDIALASDITERAPLLLTEVERHCQRIGLQLNAKKAEVMAFNVGNVEGRRSGARSWGVVPRLQVLGCLDSIRGGHQSEERSSLERPA